MFHLSTFAWFALQIVLMFFLFRHLMDYADPHPSNVWTALLAAAVYGLHPAMAETVNYIIQRADLYSTLGVVAALLWFIARPGQRRLGLYLIPAVLAYLSKAPALVFPFILLAYVLLFESDDENRGKLTAALRATWPAFAVTLVLAILMERMSAGFSGNAASPSMYRLSQPLVALHYFASFFLPTGLSVDPDWSYVPGAFSLAAIAGYLFVIAIGAAAVLNTRGRELRPVAFGLIWFLLALLPTALMPLAEVTNDHRMFFPFVGLSLAVFWTLRLVLFGATARLTRNEMWTKGAVVAAGLILLLAAVGTFQRNRVWHDEESLWRDATAKNPENGRAWLNYGNVYMARRDYATALQYYERARSLSAGQPYQPVVESSADLANSMLRDVLPVAKIKVTPESLLNLSAEYCRNANFIDCLSTARQAAELRPSFAEAYNNMAAAYFAMQQWDDGIAAAKKAMSLKPGYKDAENNLKWALAHRPGGSAPAAK